MDSPKRKKKEKIDPIEKVQRREEKLNDLFKKAYDLENIDDANLLRDAH